MAYISWDRGWRAASATVDTEGFVPSELILHDDESSNNFELGFKGDFWNRRARYSTSMYYQNYQNFQVQADGIQGDSNGNGSLDPADRKFNAIVNADKVLVRGAELEITALIQPAWTAFVSLSYNDTKFDKFDDAPCNSGIPLAAGTSYNTCDFTGKRISDAPNWSTVVSSDYSIGFDDFGAELYFRILAKYDGDREFQSTGLKVSGDTTVDIFTGFRDFDGRWDVSLWVKNVTDKAAIRSVDVNTVGKTTYLINDPLTVGVSGTYNWGID
jgi:iron complex outermembrane receptor protein